MFYEVRVLDSDGKIKKVLSSKKLSSNYWKGFFEKVKGKSPSGSRIFKRKGRAPKRAANPALDKFDDEYSLTDEG